MSEELTLAELLARLAQRDELNGPRIAAIMVYLNVGQFLS